jgi:hypothetical protein
MAETKRNSRPSRIPVSGSKRDLLTVSGKEDGYVYRWVNDTTGRIQRFKDAGYEVVDHQVAVGTITVDSSKSPSSTTERLVGKDGTKAVLMRQKAEWYEEDQAAKAQQIRETEETIKREALVDRYGKLEISRS